MRITTRKTKYYKTKNALWCLSKWASSLPVQNSSKFGWFSLKPRWRAGRTRSRKRVHRLKGMNRSPKTRIGTFLSSDSAYDSAAYSVVKTKGITNRYTRSQAPFHVVKDWSVASPYKCDNLVVVTTDVVSDGVVCGIWLLFHLIVTLCTSNYD